MANLSFVPLIIVSTLLSPTGIALAVARITELEQNTGLQFSTLYSSTILANLIGLILSIIFYFTLAVYFDRVVPNEYGVRRKWYAPFSDTTERRKSGVVAVEEEDEAEGEDVEVGEGGEFVVKMEGLRKVYNVGRTKGIRKEKVAVRGLGLGIFEGEIFGLLG